MWPAAERDEAVAELDQVDAVHQRDDERVRVRGEAADDAAAVR